MSYSTAATVRTAPLILRNGVRRDSFRYVALWLGLGLALFGLGFGAPTPPGAQADGGFVVSGP